MLKGIPDNSIDSVVTDPPYALVSIVKRFGGKNAEPTRDGDVYSRSSAGFMGKQWDTGETAFAVEFWQEVFRVLKPGGHVASFSGTRTYHRMAVAVEDAGFEIRDQLAWVYGSGFPKSHDVSKGIDKAAGAVRERKRIPYSQNVMAQGIGVERPWMDAAKEVGFHELAGDIPATDAAREWQGWGTALKPAWEPICLARKPLIGTVAANVLEHGTGALNIDGCRVGTEGGTKTVAGDRKNVTVHAFGDGLGAQGGSIASIDAGRWPANIVHDGSDEVLAEFPDAPGQQRATGPQYDRSANVYGKFAGVTPAEPRLDSGSAARFFYTAKAGGDDRLGSKHPTVKPVDLMQWLCRLITPPGGLILDPFSGTGTTGEAAYIEGFRAILVEREAEYQADIRKRMSLVIASSDARKRAAAKPIKSGEPDIFDGMI